MSLSISIIDVLVYQNTPKQDLLIQFDKNGSLMCLSESVFFVILLNIVHVDDLKITFLKKLFFYLSNLLKKSHWRLSEGCKVFFL